MRPLIVVDICCHVRYYVWILVTTDVCYGRGCCRLWSPVKCLRDVSSPRYIARVQMSISQGVDPGELPRNVLQGAEY